nr:tRNA lysidine(34) synthetase TilS [Parvibaculum indicum]
MTGGMASSGEGALRQSEFDKRLNALSPGRNIAVALSGGPDSLALLLHAARWAKRRKGASVLALTVDHGLRAEAAKEAARAGAQARALGVSHRILKWQGKKPSHGIQAAAREARYALMAAACRKAGIGDLLLAHHLEDQAETFLLRLARGSGVDGLSAMAAARDYDGQAPRLRLLRPLLDVPRARLAAGVAKAGLTPAQDPSNEDERYERVRLRRALPQLAEIGLDAATLARSAERMARAREALDGEAARFMSLHGLQTDWGSALIEREALAAAPDEIALRVLARLGRTVGGGAFPPRDEALRAILDAVRAGGLGRGRTLSGCKFADKGRHVAVTRELAAARGAAPLALSPGDEGVWDGRFRVFLGEAPARRGGYRVDLLGPEGLKTLRAAGVALPDVPSQVLAAMPALFAGKRLIAAPFGEAAVGIGRGKVKFRAIPVR